MMFGISEAALSGIVNKRKSVEDAIAKGTGSKRETILCINGRVETALLKWFHKVFALSIPVCSPLIKEQAVKFVVQTWLQQF